MRLVLIAAATLLAALLLVLAWQAFGQAIVVAWLDFQRDVNRYVAAEMRALKAGTSLVPLFTGLGLAFLYGVVHAIGPGHGKLVIASYLATRDAKPWYAYLLAARMGAMHVVSAVIVVAFADYLLRRTFGGIPTEAPAIRVTAYAVLTVTGLWMLRQAWRRYRFVPPAPPANPGTSLVQAHLARHRTAAPVLAIASETGFLAFAVGLVPCTGSILILSFAIANGVLWAGYLLVAAIAVGMTITMTALGLGAIGANRLIARRFASTRLTPGLLDVSGAAIVAGFGLLLLSASLLP